MLRRIFAIMIALTLILSAVPTTAFAQEDGQEPVCTCGAQPNEDGTLTHTSDCPLYEEPKPIEDGEDTPTCTGDENCPLTEGHNENCPVGRGLAPAVCTCTPVENEDGTLTHSEDCPVGRGLAPAVCTCGTETDTHASDCALNMPPLSGEVAPQGGAGGVQCTCTPMENEDGTLTHSEDCPVGRWLAPAACTCGTETDTHASDCALNMPPLSGEVAPQGGAGGVQCTCTPMENEDGTLTHSEDCPVGRGLAPAVCPHDNAITPCPLCAVQTLIDALPDTVTAENQADVIAQLEAIDAAKLALTDEERETIDFTKYLAAIEALAQLEEEEVSDPEDMVEEEENWANCTSCSAENPHMISTTADLDKIRTHIDTVNKYGGEGNCINGYFELANDIEFADSDYTEGGAFYNPSGDNLNFGFLPIGHTGGQQNMVGNMFVGEFNGNGKTIKNFKTWTDPEKARWFNALFARTWDAAYIHDFTMSDSYIRGSHTAAIVGQANSGTTRIENITLKNVVLENDWLSGNSNKGSGVIAGMFQGTIKNINIENCTYKNHNTSVYGGLIVGKYLGGNGVQNITISGGHYDIDSTSGLLFGSVGGNTTISNISVNGTEIFVRDNNFRYFAYGMDSNATVSNIQIDVDVVGGNANTDTQKLTNNNIGNATGITLNVDFSGTANGNALEGNLNARVEKNVIYISNQTANNFKLIPATQEICGYLNGGTFASGAVFSANKLTKPEKEGYIINNWYSDADFTTKLEGDPVAGSTYYAKWNQAMVLTGDVESFEIVGGETEADAKVYIVRDTANVKGTITVKSGYVKIVGDATDGADTLKKGFGTSNFFTVSDGANLTMENLTIDGGAVWTGSANATLNRGTVNTGVSGGNMIKNDAGYAMLKNCTLQNHDGDQIFNCDKENKKDTLYVDGCKIVNSSGGVLWTRSYATFVNTEIAYISGNPSVFRPCTNAKITISTCDIHHNYGTVEAGVIAKWSACDVTASDTKFHHNFAPKGAVLACNTNAPYFYRCEITNNTASIAGGAFYLYNNNGARVIDTVFSGNTAPMGSAIYTEQMMIFESGTNTVSGNTGSAAIYLKGEKAVLQQFGNCTFSNNPDGDIYVESYSYISVETISDLTISAADMATLAIGKAADTVDLTQIVGKIHYNGTVAEDTAIVPFVKSDGSAIQFAKVKLNADETHEAAIIPFTTLPVNTLPTPKKDHHIFVGWCTDAELQNALGDAALVAGNTYYAKYTKSGYTETPVAQRTFDFGEITYGETQPTAKNFTFEFSPPDGSPDEAASVTALTATEAFNVTFSGATVTIQPKANLNAGIYEETIHVTVHDGSVHSLYAKLTVKKAGSTTLPPQQTVFSATYGDTITLTVNVAKAESSIMAMDLDEPEQDTVAFYCGETLLGEVAVDYGNDTTKTSGTASLTYDTSKGGIPVQNGNTVTVKYGGSINLVGSNGTITVNLAPKTLTVSGLMAKNRVYDGTTTVTLTWDELTGLVGSDEVTIVGTLADANAGQNKPVTRTLSGADAGNYVLSSDPVTVNIAPHAAPTITFPSEQVSKLDTDGPFTIPATASPNVPLTYSSSDSAVASVDAATGTVTVHKAGSAVITATSAAGNYQVATASYTLTVAENSRNTATSVEETEPTVSVNYDSDCPKTGDVTQTGLYLALAFVGLSGILMTLFTKKKHQ